MREQIKIQRAWAMPDKNTFTIAPIREFILREMTGGKWIDPFANENTFADITNDLNPKFNTTYHMDALDFLRSFENESVDGVLFDPPYSLTQVKECYEGFGLKVTDQMAHTFYADMKAEIGRIVKPNGKVLCFGWNSGGIGMSQGFKMERILLVAHGGVHNDTICTVERKMANVNIPSLFT